MPVLDSQGRPDLDATYERFSEWTMGASEVDHVTVFEEGVWCYDQVESNTGATSDVDFHCLLDHLVTLAEDHEPAMEFLIERRDRMRARIEADGLANESFYNLWTFNRVLQAPEDTLAAFLGLEANHPDQAARVARTYWREWYAIGALDVIERYPPPLGSTLRFIIADCAMCESGLHDPLDIPPNNYYRDLTSDLIAVMSHLGHRDAVQEIKHQLPSHVWVDDSSSAEQLVRDHVDNPSALLLDPLHVKIVIEALAARIPARARFIASANSRSSLLASRLAHAVRSPVFALEHPPAVALSGEPVCLFVDVLRSVEQGLGASVARLQELGAGEVILVTLATREPGHAPTRAGCEVIALVSVAGG